MNFAKEVIKLDINLSFKQLELLENYYDILLAHNKTMNLTSITMKKEVYLKHFYDSLTLIKALDLNKPLKVCDMGSGAGFPGIVLKIAFPKLDITLVDSLNKRVEFLNQLINLLELENIRAIHMRGEDFVKSHRSKFDLVTARAVMKLNMLDEICLPLVKKEGYFIPMKANVSEELEIAKKGINMLGGKVEEVVEFILPIEGSKRTLVKIKKVKDTNNKYPRKFADIKNKPL